MLTYIHIPYCDSKCHYCSFNSYVDKFDTRRDYMQALTRQLAYELERFEAKKGDIETLFIGGGTPSTVAPEAYTPIFELLAPYFAPNAEITTEANPNSSSKAWLQGMHELGVNRVSFGVQSFDAQKLRKLNRAHSPEEAIEAVKNAKAIGIEHISLDLIYNYAGDTKELLHDDIETAFSLPIDHISAYELTIEEGTKFATTPEVRQSDDEIAFFVADTIKAHGFTHYEISNFGHYQSRHNQGYWRLEAYIGAGAGAVGFRKNERFYPHSDVHAYIDNPLHTETEALTSEMLRTESIFLGLRSTIGIDADILTPAMYERATLLCKEGKLLKHQGRFINPDLFIADSLALYILD